jgi:hypothetical protein
MQTARPLKRHWETEDGTELIEVIDLMMSFGISQMQSVSGWRIEASIEHTKALNVTRFFSQGNV